MRVGQVARPLLRSRPNTFFRTAVLLRLNSTTATTPPLPPLDSEHNAETHYQKLYATRDLHPNVWGSNTIFINSAPATITEEFALQKFGPFGDITRVRMDAPRLPDPANPAAGWQNLTICFRNQYSPRAVLIEHERQPFRFENKALDLSYGSNATPPSRIIAVYSRSNIDPAALREVLLPYGKILDITQYHNRTRHQFHVLYGNVEEAARVMALHLKNPFKLGRQQLFFESIWARSFTPSRAITISQFDSSLKIENITGTFSKFGPIQDIRFDRNSTSVIFEDVNNAIDAMEAHLVSPLLPPRADSKPVLVNYQSVDYDTTGTTDLLITDVPIHASPHRVIELFSKYGKVVDVLLTSRSELSHMSPGLYMTCRFETEQEAELVLSMFRRRAVNVPWVQPTVPSQLRQNDPRHWDVAKKPTLTVKGLPEDVTKEELQLLFSAFGTVREIYYHPEQGDFAHIAYASTADSERAMYHYVMGGTAEEFSLRGHPLRMWFAHRNIWQRLPS
ncbi:hypothetical protein DL96DRAFT_1811796 [Flagelloscypha sp. PMI_526]|nr:hypothetical protein DL96DRAFT_1811796 [Flagelloscypha sp. PMI_526]